MKDLEQIKKMLMHDEGVAYKPYRCTSGKLTAGVGRNLDDGTFYWTEIKLMLENDIKYHIDRLQNTFSFFNELSDARQCALINLSFNLGFSGFCTFKRMIEALGDKDYTEAAKELLDSKYARSVNKHRARRLADIIATDHIEQGMYNDFQVIQ